MATISEIVNKIRTAILGKDVREAIASGIEKCYEDASTNSMTISDGAVSTEKLADGSVTNDKIATGTITASKIQDGEVVKMVLFGNHVVTDNNQRVSYPDISTVVKTDLSDDTSSNDNYPITGGAIKRYLRSNAIGSMSDGSSGRARISLNGVTNYVPTMSTAEPSGKINYKVMPLATSETSGAMSAADKTKLDLVNLEDLENISSVSIELGETSGPGSYYAVLTIDGESYRLPLLNPGQQMLSGNLPLETDISTTQRTSNPATVQAIKDYANGSASGEPGARKLVLNIGGTSYAVPLILSTGKIGSPFVPVTDAVTQQGILPVNGKAVYDYIQALDIGAPTDEQVNDAVTDWMEENISSYVSHGIDWDATAGYIELHTYPEDPEMDTVLYAPLLETTASKIDSRYIPIDNTLTQENIPADAKKTGDEISDLKNAINSLDETLVSEGTIKKKFNAINVYPGSTVNSSGIITNGPSGSDKNVYVFNVPENTKILATGGSPYGLFATNPVKNSTQSVDQTRHLGTLNNTEITMPTGANYIAIVHTAESVVVEDTKTTNEIVEELTSEVENIIEFINVDIAFTFSGFIRYDGALINNADYKTTDFVPVTNNGTYIPLNYKVKVINATQFAFYDGQKQFIKAVEVTTSSALTEVIGVLPYVSGAVYVRLCSYSNNYTDYFAKYSTIKNVVTGIIPYPTDFQGSEISVFNKILCIGDSLTSGTFNYRVGSSTGNYIEDAKYSYPAYLKKLTGCDTTNMGNGGKTSLEWYQMHANDDLSGYDCAIIQLGVNDVGKYSTWGQNSIDGFTGIINKLKTENKNIRIFVANIIPARSYHTDGYINMSTAISNFIEGLNDPQVMLLDIQQYGHTYDSAAYNCGHLSALGYWRLAQDYKAYISWYIFMNKTDFKEVQFIGTDYYYDPIN